MTREFSDMGKIPKKLKDHPPSFILSSQVKNCHFQTQMCSQNLKSSMIQTCFSIEEALGCQKKVENKCV